VLVQPWALLAVTGTSQQPSDDVPVKLIDQQSLPKELFADDDADKPEVEEGISFEAEGYVSAGYLDLLKARIFSAWEYPEDAIHRGEEGVVSVRFVLDAAGRVVETRVTRSSGSRSLDEAVVSAVRKAGPFGPFREDQAGGTMGITGHFCYVLD
jgi:protein TonB